MEQPDRQNRSLKKIFLFDPTCLSYRIHVYEYFINEFRKKGYNLTIFYDSSQTSIDREGFCSIEFNFRAFLKLHINEKPDISIFFILLRYKFFLFFLMFCRIFMPVKSIVWSKGVNITDINQPFKNILYYIRQYAADALIIYSNFEKQFVKPSLEKVFVANNTINQNKYTIYENKKELKKEFEINYEKAVLFVGRIERRKRLDLLIEVFEDTIKEHALIIVGPGLDEKYKTLVRKCDNIYYLGPVYDLNLLSKIYSLSDVFCIPGHIGLGLNEAFIFGLPVVTANINKDPSLVSSEPKILFKNEFNGLFYEPFKRRDLERKLQKILNQEDVYHEYSKNAKNTFHDLAKIEIMFSNFLEAVKYLESENDIFKSKVT